MSRSQLSHGQRANAGNKSEQGLLEVLRHDYFIKGYASFALGLPFARDASRSDAEEWHYEQGRKVVGLGKQRLGHVPRLWCGPAGLSSINPKVIDLAGSMMVDLS